MWKATYVAHLVQLTVYCEAKKLSDSGVTLFILIVTRLGHTFWLTSRQEEAVLVWE